MSDRDTVGTSGRHAGWLVLASVGFGSVALWPSVASLNDVWRETHDYEHGYLVVAVSLVWLVGRCRKISLDSVQPSAAGTGVLALTLLMWLIAFTANSLALHQFLFPTVIWSLLWASGGWLLARRVLAPVAFLYFAVPIWEYAGPTLQQMSVFVTEKTLGLLGIPAVVNDYRVVIPAGTFEIVEGCSGKRYFIVALALAAFAGSLWKLGVRRFVALMAAAAALALFANWLRIVIVVYAGQVTNMQHYFVAVEHQTLGEAIFAVLVVCVLLLVKWLAPPRMDRISAEAEEAGPTAGPWRFRWTAAIPFCLLILTFALLRSQANAALPRASLGSLPIATAKWQGPLPPAQGWSPRYVAPDAEQRVSYSSAAGSVEVYVNVYGEQHQGRELIFYSNTLMAPGEWQRAWPPVSSTLHARSGDLAAFEGTTADGAWLIAYTYQVGNWVGTSAPWAQLMYGARSLVRSTPMGMIALASRCAPNCKAAEALVTSFWDDMAGSILPVVSGRNGEG